MKGNRKPEMMIYRPGSGPLRKSAQGDDEECGRRSKSSTDNSLSSRNPSHTSSQEHLGRPNKRMPAKVTDLEERMKNMNVSGSKDHRNNVSSGASTKKKSKKPEQALYVPKPLVQARDIVNKSPVNSVQEESLKVDEPVTETNTSLTSKQAGRRKSDRSGVRKQSGGIKDGEGKSHAVRYVGGPRNSQTNESEQNSHQQRRDELRQVSEPRVLPTETNISQDIEQNINHLHQQRRKEVRQTSEPRALPLNASRMRVTEQNFNHSYQQRRNEMRRVSEPQALALDASKMQDSEGSVNHSFQQKRSEMRQLSERQTLPLDTSRMRETEQYVNHSYQQRRSEIRQASEPQALPLDTSRMRETEQNVNHSYQQRRSEIRQASEPHALLVDTSRIRDEQNVNHSYHQRRNEVRQASEPRTLPMDTNRIRDTRSMEPAGRGKPPSGRRGSFKEISLQANVMKSPPKPYTNYDSLPPRLKKKYLAENMVAGSSYIGTNSEDPWDGSTVTFQGSSGNFIVPDRWSHTLPRGRGRLRPEEVEMEKMVSAVARFSRSLTPDCLPNPGASSGFSQESLKPTAPVNEKQWIQPVGNFSNLVEPVETFQNRKLNENKTEPEMARNSPSPKILDWSEEVEQSERLEAEGMLSDVMTRSSSLTSLSQSCPPRERRKRRKKPSGGGGGESRGGTDSRRRTKKKQRSTSGERSIGYSVNQIHHNNRNSAEPDYKPPSRDSSYDRGYRDHNLRGHSRYQNRGKSRQQSNRGLSQDQNIRDQSQDRNFRGHSQDRNYGGHSQDRNYRGHSQDRNYRGQSQDRNYRGHSRDPNNRDHSKDRNIRGHSQDRNSRGQSQDQNNRRHSRDENNRKHNRGHNDRGHSRDRNNRGHSRDRNNIIQSMNWREEQRQHVAGILVIPPEQEQRDYPVHRPQQPQRQLFDPNNPSKPIIVSSPGARAAPQLQCRDGDLPPNVTSPGLLAELGYAPFPCQDQVPYVTDQYGNTRPTWYDPYSTSFRSARNPHLLLDIERADLELQWILNLPDGLLLEWERIMVLRQFLQQCLHMLLVNDLKFCQTENVEQHFWKILFYNFIEILRKGMAEDADNKEKYKQTMLSLIEQGTVYFEKLLQVLEVAYKFKLETFLAPNATPGKGLGYAGLALVSAQKIFIFLGDLARYKEQVNETTNYGDSRHCYIKAHQLNPKNGRPYNQLAILALYVKRKLDAVYYYMRSLMASNPFHSARESLLSLFDESRKKYEQAERRRREDREVKLRDRMKEKEGAGMELGGNGLRREYWVHPEKGRPRLHITTSTVLEQHRTDSEEEELAELSSADVNKRFVTSYLHVHGKLFTKIGMETFQEAAVQMLREFRVLLQHSPIPLPANRFLQLLALNMFAIENTQLKETSQLEPGYRSAVQESALVVSLQMFSLILEKCVSLLRNPSDTPPHLIVGEDLQVLLPAVKVWCDWLLCHSSVWNPPPSCLDYRVGPPGDAWSRVASLVNLLENLDHHKTILVTSPREDFELVRLPEDATLSGFTPLMYNDQEPIYVSKETDSELAHMVLRIRKIIFFGTVFLCGVDPPVLKLQKFDGGFSEYVSVVQSSSQGSPSSLHEDQSDSDLVVESFSEDEDDDSTSVTSPDPDTSTEIQSLLHRKEKLERRHRKQERHRQRVQEILRDSVVSVEIEVKPHHLVPDTNCFIDYLSQLQTLVKAGPAPEHFYTLMVPLVVMKELEGLARGGRDRDFVPVPNVDPEHAAKVAEAAKQALTFLRSRCPGVRCVTTRGNIITNATCALEEDTEEEIRNDDKILATSLSLCKASGKDQSKPGEPRRLYREVVLLTEDRNLRVKALARHVPVREVPDFMQWAGLG